MEDAMGTTIVVGAEGQLGRELMRQLDRRGETAVGLGRRDCHLSSWDSVHSAVQSHEPSRVFNAAAYNDVDGAEEETDIAFDINAAGPGRLASACREVGARLMHFSTDYVFGHGYSRPIDESRDPEPLSAYGRSKLLGERLALTNNDRTFVVRTCGLYSHRRSNFVRTMIRHGIAGTDLEIVDDQTLSPTWVRPLRPDCL